MNLQDLNRLEGDLGLQISDAKYYQYKLKMSQ